MSQHDAVEKLRRSGLHRGLCLFLGAGVSQGSDLPSWKQLVARMYFSAMRGAHQDADERIYPHYLYAVADWYVERHLEPLDITARKIRACFQEPDEFRWHLRRTLYRRFLNREEIGLQVPDSGTLQSENPTLRSIVKLCTPNAAGRRRARLVITYNYDDLVALALPRLATPVWAPGMPVDLSRLPVYHVHGYAPLRDELGSHPDEIVFTEQQYHAAAHRPYNWSNLIQMQYMAGRPGLMIGLSVTDPNMRRLLDAVSQLPERRPHFALLQRPSLPRPSPAEKTVMYQKAMERARRLHLTDAEPLERHLQEMEHTLRQVETFDLQRQETVLRDIGVQPIWFDHPSEIPALIDHVLSPV